MKYILWSIFLIIFSSLILHGCKNKVYQNKTKYEIGVNETIEIYYSTNSCCYYCVSNQTKLKHTILIDDKLIIPEKEGCDGCSHTSAFVFKGVSKGIDTLELKQVTATMNCNSNEITSVKYIIEIK